MFNVIREEEAPNSLAAQQKYDSKDVLEALNRVFHKKCYICETSEPQDINVEHFVPHRGDNDLKYKWTNLYLACSRCNNIKSARYDNLIDCCDSEIDVLRAIKHIPPLTPYAERLEVEARMPDDITRKTAELLDKVFNGKHTPNKAVSGAYLRKKIFAQYNLLLEQLNTYYNPLSLDTEKEFALERIKLLIKPSSPYSAFISWCVLEDQQLGPLLENHIGLT